MLGSVSDPSSLLYIFRQIDMTFVGQLVVFLFSSPNLQSAKLIIGDKKNIQVIERGSMSIARYIQEKKLSLLENLDLFNPSLETISLSCLTS